MSLNAPVVSAGEALETLSQAWEAQKAGLLTASWMLHGRPGVGKTEVVRALAERNGAELHDLRLTTIDPQDLRGLPAYDHTRQRTTWYRPEDLPDDPGRPSILFLDELTAADPGLQPTVYGLLQERRVGRHVLPASVFVVAAGNTVEDGAVAYEMGTALSDRLIHLHVRASADDWLRGFAVARGIHPAVTAFLRSRPELFETTEDAIRRGQMVACTPRSWERVSDIMRAVADRRTRDTMIAGTIGAAPAADFALVADEIAATLDVAGMLSARRARRADLYPESVNGLVALVYGLVASVDAKRIGAVIETMADIRHLPRLRDRPGDAGLPLGEICSFGFEILIARALRDGLEAAFASSEAYRDYAAERDALGLD